MKFHLDEARHLQRDEHGHFTAHQIVVPDAHGFGVHEYHVTPVSLVDAHELLLDGIARWETRVRAFPDSPLFARWMARRHTLRQALDAMRAQVSV